MSPGSAYDPPVSHIDGTRRRRDAALRQREMRPLLTNEPLTHDRERKPATHTQRKRKRVLPTTPALSFDPKRNNVPSGRQYAPVSPSAYSRPSTSESSMSSHDENQATSFANREIRDQFYNGHDAQKRPRITPECAPAQYSTSFYPDSPCTDVNDTNSIPPSDFYDSPVSYTSSSSPAPSDQSPRTTEFAFQVIPLYAHGMTTYVQQSMAHQDYAGHCSDRRAQGYSPQYSDTTYGRPAPHGAPTYTENNGYVYPLDRKY